MVFVKADYEIESGEAERVAVDHASKSTTTGTGSQSGRERISGYRSFVIDKLIYIGRADSNG